MSDGNPREVCPYQGEDHACPESWRLRTLHSRPEIVPFIEELVQEMERAGFSRKESFAVRLALEEALVNAIKHGHREDTSKEVRVRHHVTETCVLVEVEDQGPGFRPEEVPDPLALENLERSSGRGLLLMRNYMTWVRHNAAGTCVTLCKRRKA
jgi:serine/threonine-protein kinase RsbW